MKQTFLEVLNFIKQPIYQKNYHVNFKGKLIIITNFLGLSLLTSIALLIPIGLLLELFGLNEIEHDLNKLLKEESILYVLFMVAILAPLLEELIFRAPLILFKNKKYFSIVFYTSAISFGVIHIFNYEMSTKLLVIAPVLIMPQLILGLYFGYIRTRLGLRWSIFLHACYNAILIIPVFLFDS